MSLTTRVVPLEERAALLRGTPWEDAPMLRLVDLELHVVERDGKAVGAWALFPVWHAEGIWIDATAPEKAGIAVRLWRALTASAKRRGLASVWTGCDSPAVADILTRLRAERVPFDSFVLPLERA